jgi:hypothetical protein
MSTATDHRTGRLLDFDSFRVVPHQTEHDAQLYTVVGPSGVALYTFTDIHAATAEASVLNTARVSDRGVSQLVVSDER